MCEVAYTNLYCELIRKISVENQDGCFSWVYTLPSPFLDVAVPETTQKHPLQNNQKPEHELQLDLRNLPLYIFKKFLRYMKLMLIAVCSNHI